MSRFNEANTVETPILDWLQTDDLGWRYEDARAVAGEYRARRSDGTVDEREVLLLPVLKERLLALNPGVIIDDDRAERVISRLRAERDNQEWVRWLRGEKTMKFAVDEPEENIQLIDYDDLDANDFLATNQFRVEGPKDNIRTDLLLFVNGIPLVNVEAKTTGRDWHIDWTEGAKQCGRYLRQAPQLYYSNLLCGAVNELVFRYGVPGAKFHTWHQWRDPWPHTHIPEHDGMKRSVYGLLDRRNLLDMARHFVVFETEEGRPVKKVARYQQFAAANELVRRALELGRPREWRRGLVWHTQGSGKSLTILFAARKLWHHPELQQPTILIVIDRDQLQDQMIGQFIRTNTEICRVAESKTDLVALLGDGDGFRGIIVTIMHKFAGHERVAVPRRNVVALVDEAHRSQEGEFGKWMRAALPEASLFGFTGTPIENDDHNTPLAFGRILGQNDKGEERIERYMQPGGRYSIADAIRDGATQPIHYEPRVGDWAVWGEKLDFVFEREFGHLPEGEREQLRRENAKLEVILKLPKRVRMIAEDVAKDFTERVRPNRFKAMLVCYDKETCSLYKAALDELLGKEAALCVFSEDPERDGPGVKEHYLGDANRKKAIEEFKKEKPEDPAELAKPENRYRNVEIFIVCDMLLTGFDAPLLQTMYLDKGLRDHTLLQAMARVNRPYKELKKVGVVLDYFGVFEHLQDALNFDKNELGEVAFPLTRLREQFRVEMQWQRELFAEFPKTGDRENLMNILAWLNGNEPKREKFELGYRNLNLLWETLHPDPFVVDHEGDYLWLSRLWIYYAKEFYPKAQRFETDPADSAKTRELIRQHVDVEELKRNLPSYTLDADYLTKLKDRPPDSKALNIEAMLASELSIRAREDPEFEPLSERLKRIVQAKRNGTVAGLALLSELEQLAQEVVALIQESRRPLAETLAGAAKERSPGLEPDAARQIAAAIVAKADEMLFPGWPDQEHIDTELFRAFTMLLAKEFPAAGLHRRDQDFVDRCIKTLRRANYRARADG
ncbi:MAG: HsdR family type I site-specific deoxyribonuclease [Deltaproteobacteria bacterium]|nr:HsdR family type I site-specific deoxyribonuclease [Deltaproteobacteria bacterium]